MVYMASAEREPIAGVWGGAPSGIQRQSPWSGGQGANPGGILISHDKNKIETEEINSDTSQMEK